MQLKPHTPPPILLQLQTPLITIEFHITNKTSMKTQQKRTFPSHIEEQNNYHTCYQHIVLKLKTKTLPLLLPPPLSREINQEHRDEKNADFENEDKCQMQSQFGSMYNLP